MELLFIYYLDQIFILRRYHEHYHFKLYGIPEINIRQLFVLLSKVLSYFVIQLLFKLNKRNRDD